MVANTSKEEEEEQEKLKKVELDIRHFQSCANHSYQSIAEEENNIPILHEKQVTTYQHRRNNLPQSVAGEENDILILASRYNKIKITKFLIKHRDDLDINHKDANGYSAADYALDKGHYKLLLLLLKTDSCFPIKFDVLITGDNTKKHKKLRNFLKQKNCFHELIKQDNLKKIKNFRSKIQSNYYLNSKNESALFTAVNEKKLEVYAFLRSEGVQFFSDIERIASADTLVGLFPSLEDSHIYYMISKSRSQKPVENFYDKMCRFYRQLDKISQVSIIMKVIQYSDYFDIVFDFDNGDVMGIYPTRTCKLTRGETDIINKRVFIAAKRDLGSGKEGNRLKEEDEAVEEKEENIIAEKKEKKMLGTLAHELAHLAMLILFQNDCNPYHARNEEECNKVKEKVLDFVNQKLEAIEKKTEKTDEAFDILSEAMDKGHISNCELIVRVPHILTECDDGKEWLEKNVSELVEFYEKFVIPECKQFIKENIFAATKREIRCINETCGELKKLQFYHEGKYSQEKLEVRHITLKLKEIDKKIEKILKESSDKNILLIITECTLLSMIKVLQSVFDSQYVIFSHRYIILEFGNFMKRADGIMKNFYSEICNYLIIRFLKGHEYGQDQLGKGLKLMAEFLQKKSYKKIVLIADSEMEQKLSHFPAITSAITSNKLEKINDEHTTLDDLSLESKTEIISKEIIFEGTKTKIIDLVGTDFENHDLSAQESLHQLISGDIIEKILEKKDVYIGSQTSDIDNLEGAYIFVDEKIDEETFISKFDELHDIFIISGMEQIDKRKSYLNSAQDFLEKSKSMNSQNITKTDKKLIVTENRFTNGDFKKFCQENNGEKKIYLIEMARVNNVWTLTLKQVYNPNFCLPRSFIQPVDGNKTLVSEKYLAEELDQKAIIIIADMPGTGKSTTLNKLLKTTMAEKHWVIKMYPNKNVKLKLFCDSPKIDKIKHLIELLKLVKPKLSGAEKFLNAVLDPTKNFGKYPLFVFDGLDEILDEDILELLKYLRTEIRCKIWITARLQYKQKLEEALSTSAFSFVPFDLDKKSKTLIKNYLQDRFELTLPELFSTDKNKDCVNFFLQEIQNIFLEDRKNIIEIPLHLYLMMEAKKEKLKEWVKKEVLKKYENKKPDSEKNILQILESFIDKKYGLYFKKLKIHDEYFQNESKRLIESYHKLLAVVKTQNEPMNEKLEENSFRPLLLGLVYAEEIDIEFSCCTFQHYYLALAFSDVICGASDNILSTDEREKCDLINKILHRPDFKPIRKIMDLILQNNIDSLPRNTQKLELFWRITSSEHRIEIEKMLCTAMVEKTKNISLLLSFIKKRFPEMVDENILTAEIAFPVFNAIYIGNSEVVKSLLCLSQNSELMDPSNEAEDFVEDIVKVLQKKDIIQNLTDRRHENGLTIFHLAASEGRTKAVKTFLEIGKQDLFSHQERYQILSMTNEIWENIFHKMTENQYYETIALMVEEITEICPLEEKSEFISRNYATLTNLGQYSSEIRTLIVNHLPPETQEPLLY